MFESLQIVEVRTRGQTRDFLNLPYVLHARNPCWVPPLRIMQEDTLDAEHNPFYKHAELRAFVAYRAGRAAGRIAAIRDEAHNAHFGEKTAHFGFLETVDDAEVAQKLFAAVQRSAKEWGLDILRGPFNPSINHECGLLVEGFEHPPAMMMPYNPAYYPPLVEACGFTKCRDLVSYRFDLQHLPDYHHERIAWLREQSTLTFRTINMSRFAEETERVWDIYTRAWEQNWGQYPLNHAEFQHFVRDFRRLAKPNYLWLAENEKREVVGFSLMLPNYNEALIHLRNGRLFPFGWARLLWHIRPGAVTGVRGLLLGLLPEYQRQGANILLYEQNLGPFLRAGFTWAELGWMLEDNRGATRAAELIGAKRYKRYRIYEKQR